MPVEALHPKSNIKTHFQGALSPAQALLLQTVAAEAFQLGKPIFLVGGMVRDMLLRSINLDFDIVMQGNVHPLSQLLQQKYGGKLVLHQRFFTAKWWLDLPTLWSGLQPGHQPPIDLPPFLDLISARRESYAHPAALPEVQLASLSDDLYRRDFTLNTLAIRLDEPFFGDLYDPWDGLRDLQRGIVRVLHPRSFIDDPTRIFRGVRFEQRFNFHFDPSTYRLIPPALSVIAEVSGERLRHEFDLIFAEESAAKALERLQTMEVLSAIHPKLRFTAIQKMRIEKLLRLHHSAQLACSPQLACYIAWFIDEPVSNINLFCERLHFDSAQQKTIVKTANALSQLPLYAGKPMHQIAELLDTLPAQVLPLLPILCDDASCQASAEAYSRSVSSIHLNSNGSTLKRLGVESGPLYGYILKQIRNAWLDGEIHSAEEENALLQQLIAKADKHQ